MALGGIIEILLGVAAERRSLEAIARPVTAVARGGRTTAATAARAG